MPFDLPVLQWFESIRNPVLTFLLSALTFLGSDDVIILLLCCLLWCLGKRLGLRVAFASIIGIGVNQSLKVLCCVPRPWVRWPDGVHPVPSAIEGASGYSFPSGHTAEAAAAYGGLAMAAGKRWQKALCWVVVAVVGISRLYLGVHTPTDVLTSLVIGLGLLLLSSVLINRAEQDKPHGAGLLALVSSLLALFTLGCARFAPGSADPVLSLDAYKAGATMLAFSVGWYIEQRWVRFDPAMFRVHPARMVAQLAIGIAVVLALLNGLRSPLKALLPQPWADMLRYGLVSAYIALGHPAWVKRAWASSKTAASEAAQD